jgi:dGTPase
MDIEDAHKLKLLSDEETQSLLFAFFDEGVQQGIRDRIVREDISDVNEQVVYLRACVIGKLENECVKAFLDNEEAIMSGTFKGSLIEHISPRQREAYVNCTKIAVKRIYKSKSVLDIELGGYSIIETLMTKMVEAILHPDRYYSKQLLMRVSSQYEINSPDLETRIMAVLDFISGMTDVFALDFYQKINGTSLPIV